MKEFMLLIPDDTQVMGINYLREITENGKLYNSFDSRVTMTDGIDAFDLETAQAYVWDEDLADYKPVEKSDSEMTDEEVEELIHGEDLSEEFENENDEEIEK